MSELKPHYIRDNNSKPVITFVVGRSDEDTFAIGISYCSDKDMPSKKVGKAIAIKRMNGVIEAYKNGILGIAKFTTLPCKAEVITAWMGASYEDFITAIYECTANNECIEDEKLTQSDVKSVVNINEFMENIAERLAKVCTALVRKNIVTFSR